MRAPDPTRRAALVAAALLSAVALAACKGRPSAAAPAPASDVREYTVRAEVVGLPAPHAGKQELVVRHEAIDDFVDASGAAVGMGAMVMPFDLAPSVSLDGVRPGDKVELRLAVGWSPPVLRVDALRKLPADTALEFRAARPPARR